MYVCATVHQGYDLLHPMPIPPFCPWDSRQRAVRHAPLRHRGRGVAGHGPGLPRRRGLGLEGVMRPARGVQPHRANAGCSTPSLAYARDCHYASVLSSASCMHAPTCRRTHSHSTTQTRMLAFVIIESHALDRTGDLRLRRRVESISSVRIGQRVCPIPVPWLLFLHRWLVQWVVRAGCQRHGRQGGGDRRAGGLPEDGGDVWGVQQEGIVIFNEK